MRRAMRPKGMLDLSKDEDRLPQLQRLLEALIAEKEYTTPGAIAYEMLENGWRQRNELAEWVRAEQTCGCVETYEDPAKWHPACRGAEFAARIVESDQWFDE